MVEKEEDAKKTPDNFEMGSQEKSKYPVLSFIIGCIFGVIYMLAISFISFTYDNNAKWVWIFLEILGPVLALLYAKPRELFWGFVTPYLLLFVLGRSC